MANKEPRGNQVRRRSHDARWETLADLVLIIAREIAFRGYTDEQTTPLTPSEGMVMRYLQTNHTASPTQIAAATGLQRTNLSTVLRGLERKALIERRASHEDARGITVHLTKRGVMNYTAARHEWGTAVSAAAAYDATDLDAALRLLRIVETGMVRSRRPQTRAPR
jgi:DNA-binding MarR family transcriptional regulator